MGSTVQTEVIIGSTDVSAKVLSWKITETFGQDTKSCAVSFPFSIFTATLPSLAVGDSMTIKRGITNADDYFEFDGVVTEIDKDGAYVTLYGADKIIVLTNSDINYSYDSNVDASSGVGSDIFKDMINTHTTLSADNTSVVSTGAVHLITKFRCKNTDVYERVKTLADIYDYQFYWDADNQLVVFEPKGYTASGVTLEVGVNVSEVPKWNYDTSQMVNNLTVKGGEQLVDNTESFNGDGAEDTFALAQVPNSVRVEVGGVLQVGGILDSTATYDYEVDRINNQIVFKAGSIPGAGVGNVVVTYDYPIPIPVNVRADVSITNYGLYSATKSFSDIESINDAIEKGNAWLDKYSEPFVGVTLKVPSITLGLKAGYQITAVDSYNNENRILTINKITKKYPHSYDEISCGDEEYRTTDFQTLVLDKIKRLEEEVAGDSDLLINVRQPQNDVFAQTRYLIAQTRDVAADAIWDLDLWDNCNWEGSYDNSPVRVRVNHPNHEYLELIYDNDFNDTGNTTATWDNTSNQIDFTDGEIAQSLAVHLNNGTVTRATLTGTSTGTLTFEMTADGTNWESVTSGSEHTFSDTGQDLRWRATSTGVSQITQLEVDYVV